MDNTVLEYVIGGAIAILTLYLKSRHNLDVMRRANEVIDRGIDLGIGRAEEEGRVRSLPGEQKQDLALEVAKEIALKEAQTHGKAVVKKVASVLADKGGDVLKDLLKSRLGLSRLKKIL